jgi:nucleoside-diphosphate-sugar epimerase
MRILVTGANGLLGHHVVFELLKRNYSVRIIVRNTQNIYFHLKAVELSVGNFTDYEQLKNAATGCDAIIHIAAVTSTNLLHYADYLKINAAGASCVAKVAEELNIKNLIFVSTANTIGFGTNLQLADELYPQQFPFSASFYARSKAEAEQIFINASKKPESHIVIINPTFMIGAFDPKPSSGKLMLMAYKKWIMFAPKGGKNFVPVSEVAYAVCNALTQGKNGERYLASGVNLTFREFYTLQKELANYNQLLIDIPDFALVIIGKVGDLLRKCGIKTQICSMNLHQLMIQEYYSNTKAKTELSLSETELEKSILEALNWFRENGKIN